MNAQPMPTDSALEQMDDAIEALSEGMAVFDSNAVLVYCNTAYRQFCRPADELLLPGLYWGILLRELVARAGMDTDTRDRLEWMETRLADGHDAAEPVEFEWPNGAVHRIAIKPTRAGGFVVTQSDISADRQFARGGDQADLLLRKVLEACPANVIMSRIGDGQVIYRSPAATELLGTTRNTNDYFASRSERADFITALLPNGRVQDMQATCLRPGKTEFASSISARVIEFGGEDVVVSTIEDLSDQQAMERELAAQREIIFQAEKMSALGELLAGVAHELNNPLSIVVGHAMMLAEETTDPDAIRRIGKIGQAAERCSGIVKSFLAMARQEPASLVPCDLVEIVDAATDAWEQGPTESTIRIENNLPADLPLTLADGDQMAQVLLNLLTNAEHAMSGSGKGDTVRITASVNHPQGLVEMCVEDNGPGIPAQIRGRIFDPLFTTKEVGQGTGIGLAFCHRIVTSHGGRIRLDSPSEGGARFIIGIPIAKKPRGSTTSTTETPESHPRTRVLIADDEVDVADLIREILTREGFDVEYANSAEAALSLLSKSSFELILTDLNMPGLGGRGLFEAISRDYPNLKERTGFVTGDTMSPAARGFLDEANRPFIEKPIAPAELRAMAHRMLTSAPNAGTQ